MQRIVSVGLGLWVLGCGVPASQPGPGPAPVPVAPAAPTSEAAGPDVTLVAQDGRRVRLADYRGRSAVVVLVMRGFTGDFACFYCGNQTRDYRASYAAVREAGAEVLCVLPGSTDARGYLAKVGENGEPPEPGFAVPFPVLGDPDLSACHAFEVPTTVPAPEGAFPVDEPATVVIAKDGHVLWTYHGRNPEDRPLAAAVLEVLRTGRPPAPVAPDVAPASPSAGPPVAALPGLEWLSYEAGMQSARETRRPILLEFYGDW